MRAKPETILIGVMALFTAVGVTAALLHNAQLGTHDPVLHEPGPLTGPEWLAEVRPYCNPVDVETRLRWQPAPSTDEGRMHEAACYALAGRTDAARASIESLPSERRYEAAGVVFATGHPAADAGDELAAGPLMELVVEYWPNHYMALYHAGAAAYERGDAAATQEYLTRFLEQYQVEDGWKSNAVAMLAATDGG